jgi:hypothetical protein
METLNLDFVDGHRPWSGVRMSNGRWPCYKPMWILCQEAKQRKARAQAQAKAQAKQALCRERMRMWLEDLVQQRIDKEDHERDVEWLRENCDWQF